MEKTACCNNAARSGLVICLLQLLRMLKNCSSIFAFYISYMNVTKKLNPFSNLKLVEN